MGVSVMTAFENTIVLEILTSGHFLMITMTAHGY